MKWRTIKWMSGDQEKWKKKIPMYDEYEVDDDGEQKRNK